MDLVDLADSGDLDAIDAVSKCVRHADDYEYKPVTVCFWLNQRQRKGFPVDAAELDRARAALVSEDPGVLAFAEVMHVSVSQLPSFLDSWPIDEWGQSPVTSLGEIDCPLD